MQRENREGSVAPESGEVWPAWVRYPVIVLFVAIGLIGVITVLYDRGWLPLAGPFVAVVVASAIVFFVMYWRNRKLKRLSGQAVDQLRSVQASIAAERALAPEARPTQATDQSLLMAAEQVELALQRFAWGHEQGAAPIVEELDATARGAWRPDAPLTEEVQRLARTTSQVGEVITKMVKTVERRRR